QPLALSAREHQHTTRRIAVRAPVKLCKVVTPVALWLHLYPRYFNSALRWVRGRHSLNPSLIAAFQNRRCALALVLAVGRNPAFRLRGGVLARRARDHQHFRNPKQPSIFFTPQSADCGSENVATQTSCQFRSVFLLAINKENFWRDISRRQKL